MDLTFKEILDAVEGETILFTGERQIDSIDRDTRLVKEGMVYFALRGDNFNGNDFALEALKKGAALVIADEITFDIEANKEAGNLILVKDSKKAMLKLASYYIDKLNIKVIGVTGSCGKTSTKDLIAAALSDSFKVFKTIGNYNNDIGMPLMIFKLDSSYDVAILEMGMNNLKEIETLAKVAKPKIAVITNVGLSHIENLKTRENILKAKLEITTLFSDNNTLIVCADNDMLKDLEQKDYKLIKTGFDKSFEIVAENEELLEDRVEFTTDGFRFSINQLGRHTILNALLAIAVAKELKVPNDSINEGFKNIEATSMRLEIKKHHKYTVIDDSYNASPDSMKAGIDVLASKAGELKICVLGDMRELGDESYKSHFEIGQYAKLKSVDMLLTTGEFKEAYLEGFKDGAIAFANKDEIVSYLKNIKENFTVLVKASRGSRFDKIVDELLS